MLEYKSKKPKSISKDLLPTQHTLHQEPRLKKGRQRQHENYKGPMPNVTGSWLYKLSHGSYCQRGRSRY